MRSRRDSFQAKLVGQPVRDWVQRGNIETSAEFEYREAARFGLLKWGEFQSLPSFEKAAVVAQYRVRNLIDAAVSEKSRRDSKRR